MKLSKKPIDQQVIVITGASSGIGLATALAAAKSGARIVLVARSTEVLADLADHIRNEGGRALALPADVGKRQELERVAAVAVESFGRIDTWVNVAGVSIFGRLDEVLDEDSRQLFETNFWGVVYGSLVALPHLRASRGTLINVGSELSDAVVPLQAMYSASKHAVKGFTDGLRMELEIDEAGVGVTLIQPTAVDTPYPENAANYLSQEPKVPSPMIAPEKVAAAILENAVDPKDFDRVGTMAVIDSVMAKVFPSLSAAMSKMQLGRQQRDEAPQTREGTLYSAGERGRVYGRGNDNPADRRAAEESNRRVGS